MIKEIDDLLKLNPDQILLVSNRITDITCCKFSAKTLLDFVYKDQFIVSIIKYTLDGDVHYQLYLDNGQIKIDKT